MRTARRPGRAVGAAAALACVLGSGCAYSERHSDKADKAEMAHSDWSNLSTNLLIDKYGPPDRVETRRLVWEKRGPWKRIVVWDMMGFFEGDFSVKNIEETLYYPVPRERRGDVREFRKDLTVSEDGAELSARSASEETNFLALNLADEIVRGKTKVADARAFYDQTVKLSESGKTSPYMKGLLFQPGPY